MPAASVEACGAFSQMSTSKPCQSLLVRMYTGSNQYGTTACDRRPLEDTFQDAANQEHCQAHGRPCSRQMTPSVFTGKAHLPPTSEQMLRDKLEKWRVLTHHHMKLLFFIVLRWPQEREFLC